MTDEQILEKLGLTNVDDASREILIGQVNSVVEMRLMTLVQELLSEEQLLHVNDLQEAGNTDAAWQYLNTELTNIDELRQGILLDYLAERSTRA